MPIDPPRNRFDRVVRVGWQAYRAAARERANVYHFHDPELMWVGALLKLGRSRVIYDVHEDLPKQIIGKPYIPAWARPLVARAAAVAEKLTAQIVDGIVAATPTIARRFPADKTVVVQNFPEASFASIDAGATAFTDRSDAFVYTGGLMEIQGVREMAEAFALLPAGMTGTVAGTFHVPELEVQVAAMPGWQRVRFLGQVPRAEVLRVMGCARCGLVLEPSDRQLRRGVRDEDVRVHGARATRRVLGLPPLGRHRNHGRLRHRGRPSQPAGDRGRHPPADR